MGLKIDVPSRVKVIVRGTFKDEGGADQPFDFNLLCRRMSADQLKKSLDNSKTSVTDFMLEVIEDWQGVHDADDLPIAFTKAAWRKLCQIHGAALVAFRAYLAQTTAKEHKEMLFLPSWVNLVEIDAELNAIFVRYQQKAKLARASAKRHRARGDMVRWRNHCAVARAWEMALDDLRMLACPF